MKNHKIISSWDKILPDENADENMLSSILDYNRSFQREDKVISMTKTMKRLFPIAACFVLVIAVTAFAGIKIGWFGTREYTITLDNGENIVYQKGSKSEMSYAYDFEVSGRALTSEEIQILFPKNEDMAQGSGTFIAETGELIRVETIVGDVHINLVKSGLPVSDVIIEGNKTTSDVNGISVKSGYFVTKANSKGIKTIIFFAEYELNDVTVYAELAGNESDSENISKQLSDMIYLLITSESPDLAAITFMP